ncbi:MAG: hypothetical protein R3C24_05980 [Cyanobacteriota/Melainabacteria group bacterium]|nr:hypothetical protein [Cyanobacteria bacterium HKST-UBA01]MCB9469514.1 hypothetical protein [Candidatus Obscuribacterales bacterium]
MLNRQINRQWLQRLVGNETEKKEDCSQKLHSVWRDQLSRRRRALIPAPVLVANGSGLGQRLRSGNLNNPGSR